MLEPKIPANDSERLQALEDAGLLYSPAEDRFDRITRVAIKLFNVKTALVSLVAENCQWFKAKTGLAAAETSRSISFCGHAILQEDIFWVPDTHNDPRFHDNPLVQGPPYIRFYAGQPISTPGGLKLGTLCIIDDSPRSFSEQDKDQLRDLGHWVENEIMMPQLSLIQQDLILELSAARRQALLDPLTSLWNRRGILEIMEREAKRTQREGNPYAIIMIDIDHFKKVNDTFGHGAGDTVLSEVAQVLRNSVRSYDAVGRLGGEEFLVMLTNSDLKTAFIIAEKIRERVALREITFGSMHIQVTLSLGVAIHGDNTPIHVETLIARADKFLYLAKDQGRNRCIGDINQP